LTSPIRAQDKASYPLKLAYWKGGRGRQQRPLWVKSGRDALRLRCPLYTQQRTLLDAVPMSDKGQKRDIRQVNASLKAHKWPLLGQMH